MKKALQISGIAAFVGVILPIMWFLSQKLMHPSFNQELVLQTIDLIICPSSLGLMVLHEDTPTSIVITAIAMVLAENAVLYIVVALLTWQGLRGARATIRGLQRLRRQLGNVRFSLGLGTIAILVGLLVRATIRHIQETRVDTQRLYDLALLQNQTVIYWQNEHSLPERMDQLSVVIYGFKPPTDPTGRRYEYVRLGPDSFELCATFDLPLNSERAIKLASSRDFAASPNARGDWAHPGGHFCFFRTVDADKMAKSH